MTRVDPALARPAAAPDHRPARASARSSRRACRRRPGAAVRRDCVLARRSSAAQSRRQEGRPGARRDVAGGHPRHARSRRHPHHARRHDLARRRGRARHGQALRLRRRLAARRLCRADHDGRRRRRFKKGDYITVDGSTGQVLAGKVEMIEPAAVRRIRHPDRLGRQGAQAGRARQRRYAERREASRSVSAPRASGSAAPSTCSSTRTASRRCAR